MLFTARAITQPNTLPSACTVSPSTTDKSNWGAAGQVSPLHLPPIIGSYYLYPVTSDPTPKFQSRQLQPGFPRKQSLNKVLCAGGYETGEEESQDKDEFSRYNATDSQRSILRNILGNLM